jgi:hypothetical protein
MTTDMNNFSILASKLMPFQLANIKNQLGPDVGEDQRNKILEFINEFRDCFASTTGELGKTHATDMHLRLHDDVPVTYCPYRLAYSERTAVRKIIQDLMDNGIVRESGSPYSSPIFLVKKKSGEYRKCVDYRSLNAKTVKDRYLLPKVGDYV